VSKRTARTKTELVHAIVGLHIRSERSIIGTCMIKTLTVTFDALERFEGPVTIDLSRPLTVIVGPNGSGKSTILEAVAEAMTFLHQSPIEAPVEQVRKHIQAQRSTQPSWTRATINVEFDNDKPLAIGDTLAKHLGDVRSGGQAAIGVSKRPVASGARWAVDLLKYFDKSIAFDTKGSIIVDSVRLVQARAELSQLEDEHNNKIATLQMQLQTQNNTSPKNNALIQKITAELTQAEALRSSPEVEARRRRLHLEIQESKNGAIRTAENGEVSKREVEALRASIC
jgi:energy-coupling factor transporter ATP-binding protein EcfA2